MKKFFTLIALVFAFTLAFTSCSINDYIDGDGENGNQTNSDESNKGEDTSQDNDNVGETRTTITAEEWEAIKNITNFTAEMTGNMTSPDTEESAFLIIKAAEKFEHVYGRYTDNTSTIDKDEYIIKEGGRLLSIEANADNKWFASESFYSYSNLENSVGISEFPEYESLTYDAEKEAYLYVSDDSSVSLHFYFKNGTIIKITCEENRESTYSEITAVISNIGTTVVEDLPEFELGLEFWIDYYEDDDIITYEVKGIGLCQDTNIIIPSTAPGGYTVTGISDGAFKDCTSITSIVIPDTVTHIDSGAFAGCTNLKYIAIPSSVTELEDGFLSISPFYACSYLTDIYFGGSEDEWRKLSIYLEMSKIKIHYNSTVDDGIVFVTNGDGTCYVDSIISNDKADIIISASSPARDRVTSIGEMAFKKCTSLANITIPDSVISIGDGAFEECTSLVSITIPDSVISIGDGAFKECTSLANITIPDSVTSIGYGAFSDCVSLTSIPISDSITSIEDSTFSGCLNLANITIPDSVTSIGYGAFAQCTSLASIVIPDGVTSIEMGAFTGCLNLANITIPDSVISIGVFAFKDCTSLASIAFPSSVTSVGDYAFGGCTGLKNITVDLDNEYYQSIDGNLYTKDGKTLIQYAIGKTGTEFTIPDSVTSIGKMAFSNCTSLVSVIMGDSVTSIGDNAFHSCSRLTNINIPDSVTSISGGAFYGTGYYNDESHWENGVLYIGNHLIDAKETMSDEYAIKDSTKVIAAGAFYNCDSLTSVVIPGSVISIGDYAFGGCTGLKNITVDLDNEYYQSIDGNLYTKDGKTLIQYAIGKTDTEFTIPDSVTSIGKMAFSNCTSLVSVIMGDSVTSIGNYAFEYCYDLASVVIPDSVTSIGDYAFLCCDALTDVYYAGSETEWTEISIGFNTDLTDATIHYDYVTS